MLRDLVPEGAQPAREPGRRLLFVERELGVAVQVDVERVERSVERIEAGELGRSLARGERGGRDEKQGGEKGGGGRLLLRG
ncbi:MAG: hypothetical protein LC780_06215 [Acidobacteria bacterium]|nr:hypothetical protein [Acidobacteriota bacterium]